MQKAGQVSLVGAGPGDWRLLTLGAKAALEQADVVVYDRLASERILDWVPEKAERIYVGKASSDHTMKQEDINQLLVEKAKQGCCVVRLKGGDPFVFGRGGEEAIACYDAGISFEIIPGVTSAIAAPAYAGIPVTHRGVAASFTVITGHEDPDKPDSSHRWENLAQGADTLIFLMGVENLPRIQQQLLAHGKDPQTPAAFVQWGTRFNQRTVVTTLEKALESRDQEKVKAPAIFIVGPVVNLREKLRWFDKRPLFGQTILVTRAREQASELALLLEDAGARVIETPMIRLVEPASWEITDTALFEIEKYSWLLFNSTNGVERFFERLFLLGMDARSLAGCKIGAVGASTAKKLLNYGLQANLIAQDFRAEGLLSAIKPYIEEGSKVLLVRAEESRAILQDGLIELGADVTSAVVYRTVAGRVDQKEVQELLQMGQVDWVTFSSSSTVKNLLELLGSEGPEWLNQTKLASIGPITSETMKKAGLKVDAMPTVYTVSALVKEMSMWQGGPKNV